LVSLTLASCGVLGKQEKTMRVETSPPGAKLNLNGLYIGETPHTMVLPRSGGGLLEFEVLPPPDSRERLWTQKRTVYWKQLPDSAVLYFDLHLESVRPTETIEIRQR